MPYEKVWNDIHYYSNDLKIAAYFYTPKDWNPGDPPRPAVVVLHGYSGMKDVYGMDVPRRLWEEEPVARRERDLRRRKREAMSCLLLPAT